MIATRETYTTTFGEYVRQLRLQRGLTQTQLYEAVGISQKTISDIEKGKTAFSRLSNFRKLADFFGVPIEELIIRAGLADSRYGATHLAETLVPVSDDDDPRDARLRTEAMGLIRTMNAKHLGDVVKTLRVMAQAR